MASSAKDTCVVILSGPVAAGKTSIAKLLALNPGFGRLSTRDAILRRLPTTALTRVALQEAGAYLDRTTDGAWLAEEVISRLHNEPERCLIVDAARTQKQVELVRVAVSNCVQHVHVTASIETLSKRYSAKRVGLVEAADYLRMRAHPTERQTDNLAGRADLVVNTTTLSSSEAARDILRLIHGRGFEVSTPP